MSKVLSVAVLVALVAAPGFAQISGTLGFDLDPGDPPPAFSGPFGSAVTDNSPNIDTAASVGVGESISTLVRLNGTQDLLGVTFDFTFDPAVLEVADIRETRMDLDFDGEQSISELNAIVNWFIDPNNTFPNSASLDPNASPPFQYTYDDGTGTGMITTRPGVLADIDDANGTNQVLDLSEVNSVVNEFLANAPGGGDLPFWTEIKAKDAGAGYAESVEIFDTKQDINASGEATDCTVVLLRRPDTEAAGFGFDGDAILLEVVFRGVATGNSNIEIQNAQGILETFTNIDTDVMPIANVETSTITVN